MRIITEGNQDEIIHDLLNGQTLVFPTETSYGLGCDAANQAAVDAIFKIKGRPSDKPLLIVVPTVEGAKKYLVWNELLEKISKKYWPGPLTVVGECKKYPISNISEIPLATGQYPLLSKGVVSKENTVAVRVTAHPLLQSITEKMGRPLVATSANLSDTGDIYDAKKIIAQFYEQKFQPDGILDYGTISRQAPTTIVSVVGNILKILRQGEINVAI